ncbi:hypothetical protein SDC9_107135 [bioreactor metagenome]|uniref:N-acetyltransferase domain-containing protein n=1 Tax=bioreactor metagenome TaxID=1076179 RepID=A0A645BEZ6_9ZZZZ
MSVFKQLFSNLSSLKLKRKTAVQKETTDQIDIIKNKGFEVLSVTQTDKANFIMYRHFFDDIPEEEDMRIFIGISVITPKGRSGRDPVLKAFFQNNFTTISLEDIEMADSFINQGLGSMLLNALLDIAKKRNIRRITGEIARVDIGHIERLVHFYEKHNFEVILCSNPTDGYKIGELVWNNS